MPRPMLCGRERKWCGGCSPCRTGSRRPRRRPGPRCLELASGTAYFSAWLTVAGARAVALDLSAEQLTTAQGLQRRVGPAFPLVQADAERIPLASGRFDLVVSEHGVAAWCDPERWMPEAARLLRPGGRLVFLTNSLLSAPVSPPTRGSLDRLLRGQRDAYKVRWPGGGVEFHPSHGDWVRLLRSAADSPSRPCTRSTRLRTPATTRSTRSCRWSGRHAGRPRSCGARRPIDAPAR